MTTMISEVYEAFRSVGVTDDKARAAAEALTDTFHDQMATKADISDVKAEIALSKAELRTEIAGTRTEIAGIKTAISDSKWETLRWIIGLISFQSIALIGAVILISKFTK
jgi:hypothetical protein